MVQELGDNFKGQQMGQKPVTQVLGSGSTSKGGRELLDNLVKQGVVTACVRDTFISSNTPDEFIWEYASQLRKPK